MQGSGWGNSGGLKFKSCCVFCHQRVDGDRLGVFRQRGEHVQQSDAVLVFLSQSQDPTAADADPGVANVGDRGKTILVRASGDDVGVMFRAGVEVMIVRGQCRPFSYSVPHMPSAFDGLC